MGDLTRSSLVRLAISAALEDLRFAALYYKKAFKVTLRYLVKFVIPVLLILSAVAVVANWYRTRYSIIATTTDHGITYAHTDDKRTTDILNYLTGRGPFPESERLSVYQQYVKKRLEESKMEVPEDFFSLNWEEVNTLATAWCKTKFRKKCPRKKEALQAFIDRHFENAIRPPLKGFTPNVNDNLWQLLERVGSPKVRWIEEQEDLPSRLVAYSAGEKRSFYYPVDHTIYIGYTDSVENLLDEVGHAKQFREDPLWSHARMTWSMMTAWVGGEFNIEASIKVYELRYKNPKTFEGEAHGPIKDALLEESGLLKVDEGLSKKK